MSRTSGLVDGIVPINVDDDDKETDDTREKLLKALRKEVPNMKPRSKVAANLDHESRVAALERRMTNRRAYRAIIKHIENKKSAATGGVKEERRVPQLPWTKRAARLFPHMYSARR